MVTILVHFSGPERIQAYLVWTFGSFGGVTRSELGVLAPVLIAGLVLAFVQAKPLNALVLGERSAESLGVAVGRTRLVVLLATALLAGGVTAFCGPCGFPRCRGAASGAGPLPLSGPPHPPSRDGAPRRSRGPDRRPDRPVARPRDGPALERGDRPGWRAGHRRRRPRTAPRHLGGAMTANAVLQATNLAVGYRGRRVRENVDVVLRSGEMVCLPGTQRRRQVDAPAHPRRPRPAPRRHCRDQHSRDREPVGKRHDRPARHDAARARSPSRRRPTRTPGARPDDGPRARQPGPPPPHRLERTPDGGRRQARRRGDGRARYRVVRGPGGGVAVGRRAPEGDDRPRPGAGTTALPARRTHRLPRPPRTRRGP